MTKDQMEKFLKSSLHLDSQELKEVIIKHVMEKSFKADYKGWEQLRFVKQEVDKLWGAIKKCSENEIVRERVDQMVASFPKPTIK